MAQHKYIAYRIMLRLYPKSHRQEYAEQMLQTLDDLLREQHDASGRVSIWARVVSELPRTVIEEHIENIKGMSMNKKVVNKKAGLVIGVVAILIVSGLVVLFLNRTTEYTPTTLAKVPRSSIPPKCLQDADNPATHIKSDDETFIGNVIAASIIDVPAGSTVNAHIKSYDGKTATGTAVYSGKYGSYNFIVKKTANNSSNSYVGGWQVTQLNACKQ